MTAREYGDELLRRLLDHAAQATGALGAGLSLAEGGTPRSVAAVGVAGVLDPAQWKGGEGPLWDALRSRGTLRLPGPDGAGPPFDTERHRGIADIVGREAMDAVRGLVVTPGEWAGEEPMVFSVYLDRPDDEQAVEVVDEYESLLGSALAIVEYCAGEEVRAEQMVAMVQYRRVIEQAKGLVMATLGGDAATAFTTLSRASQHFNIRLRNLAVALVEHVGRAPAEGPEDLAQVVVPTSADRKAAAQVWLALNGPAKGSLTPDA